MRERGLAKTLRFGLLIIAILRHCVPLSHPRFR
jgi:hypothetical protein